VDKSIWEEEIREDTNEEGVGSCDRSKRGVCTGKREDVSIVKRGERRGKRVYLGTIEEGVHLTIKVTSDGTSILCRKERQKEMDGAEL